MQDDILTAIKDLLKNVATKEDLKQFATKEDLTAALANHPTKDELREALANHPTKEELRQELANHPTKDDLTKALEKTKEEVIVEITQMAEKNFDFLNQKIDTLANSHDKRLKKLEQATFSS